MSFTPKVKEKKPDYYFLLNIFHYEGGSNTYSLKLYAGEVKGIGGLVGAGRTELLQSCFGLRRITTGKTNITDTPFSSWKNGVGYVSEDRAKEGLALNRSVSENISMATLGQKKLLSKVTKTKLEERAWHWIKTLNIKTSGPTQKVSELSGGNQQKVALARLLESDVNVLLLDEPTRGIDAGSKAEIYALIDECVQKGKSVLLTSSYMPELLGICDEVAAMYKKELLAFKPADSLTQTTLTEEICRGVS